MVKRSLVIVAVGVFVFMIISFIFLPRFAFFLLSTGRIQPGLQYEMLMSVYSWFVAFIALLFVILLVFSQMDIDVNTPI